MIFCNFCKLCLLMTMLHHKQQIPGKIHRKNVGFDSALLCCITFCCCRNISRSCLIRRHSSSSSFSTSSTPSLSELWWGSSLSSTLSEHITNQSNIMFLPLTNHLHIQQICVTRVCVSRSHWLWASERTAVPANLKPRNVKCFQLWLFKLKKPTVFHLSSFHCISFCSVFWEILQNNSF